MATAEQGKRDGAAAARRLWNFATGSYGQGAVARCCLQAQDDLGMDMILLFYVAWRASEGEALDTAMLAAVDEASRPWRDGVILPLRARRRDWKQNPPGEFEYAAIKQLEVQAERAQLKMLASRWSTAGGRSPATATPASDYAELLRGNLQALCRYYGAADHALDALEAELLS